MILPFFVKPPHNSMDISTKTREKEQMHEIGRVFGMKPTICVPKTEIKTLLSI